MIFDEELFAAFWLWLALVILAGVFAVRIATPALSPARVETA